MIMWFIEVFINKDNTKYYSYMHFVKLKVDNDIDETNWDQVRIHLKTCLAPSL